MSKSSTFFPSMLMYKCMTFIYVICTLQVDMSSVDWKDYWSGYISVPNLNIDQLQ